MMEEQDKGSILIPKIDVGNNDSVINSGTVNNDTLPKVDNVNNMPKVTSNKKRIFLGVGLFFFVFLLAIIIPGIFLIKNGNDLVKEGKKVAEIAQKGDIQSIKSELPNLKKSFKGLSQSYVWISWTKYIPFLGGYSSDLGHAIKAGQAGLDAGEIVLTTVEPYLDVFGFTNNKAQNGEQTTQERIDFVLKAIPDILPKIDSISSKVKTVNDELSQINADRYPQKIKNQEVRNKIKDVQDLTAQTSEFITKSKPVLQVAPTLLGMDSPREYLILFQNDKELRPTGGFMTAYSIMKVDKAKFEPVSSNDIYNLDAKYKPSIPAPTPLVKYIKGPYILSPNIRLRDMNWSPDFPTSMKTVSDAAATVGISGVDGIIAVDTQLLENILNVIGPIGVSGFGNFSTEIIPECNCAQVIHELESFADVEGPIVWDPNTGKIVFHPPNYDNRKRIIGPLMNSVLANALGQPKDKLPALFSAIFKSLTEKHVLFYMYDDVNQKALADFGFGGKIVSYTGDYLHINDANLGGRKSNLYATQEVAQDITIAKDGTIEKTVTITYKNPAKQDGWLNSVLPNWVRVYVPQGSKLIKVEGLEDKVDPYQDLGKTVFAGLFRLRPEGVSKVTFKYRLPFKFNNGTYSMLIQKQPGTNNPLYTINLGKSIEEFFLKADKEIKIRI